MSETVDDIARRIADYANKFAGCMFAAVDFLPIIAPLIQRAEAAEREREELRTFVDQYRGVHDSQAGWVVGIEKCTCEICEAVRAASVPAAKEGT